MDKYVYALDVFPEEATKVVPAPTLSTDISTNNSIAPEDLENSDQIVKSDLQKNEVLFRWVISKKRGQSFPFSFNLRKLK